MESDLIDRACAPLQTENALEIRVAQQVVEVRNTAPSQPAVWHRTSRNGCGGARPLPFSLTLLKATHTVYPGTDIPKDFRSRVLLDNPETGEKREVEISMNHPLRYGGYTYYQYQRGRRSPSRGRTCPPVARSPGATHSARRDGSFLAHAEFAGRDIQHSYLAVCGSLNASRLPSRRLRVVPHALAYGSRAHSRGTAQAIGHQPKRGAHHPAACGSSQRRASWTGKPLAC